MGSRRKARELVLQMLFQEDIAQTPAAELANLFWEVNPTNPETREFAQSIFEGYVERRQQIDEMIRRHARNWKLERMAVVDRNILRMGVAELLAVHTPAAVVIDEAIEVARRFSGTESSDFVNGILDSLRKELEAEKVADDD